MSQSDFGTIVATTKSGTQLASDLNGWRTAVHSGHSGTTRPSYAVAGMTWTNTAANPYVVNFYDGTDDIVIGTINTTTNVFTPSGISAGTSGGTATAFTYTPAIPSTSNLENQEYDIEFHTAAGTTPTLSVSGQTALAVKYRDYAGALQAITSTTTPTGWRSRVVNDGTYWVQREVANVQPYDPDIPTVAASQVEMEAGTEVALRSMSPLGVAQAIAGFSSTIPSGTIIDFGGSTAPIGYLACNGSAVSRATYSNLFTAIGVLWGVGDGSTTFNLPNFDPFEAAVQNNGTVGASTNGQMPAHVHSNGFTNTSSVAAGLGGLWILGVTVASDTGSTGSGTRNFAAGKYVLKCIKT